VVDKAARVAKEDVLNSRTSDDLSAVTPNTQLSTWTFGTLNKQNVCRDKVN
jgi:hypothetical protein